MFMKDIEFSKLKIGAEFFILDTQASRTGYAQYRKLIKLPLVSTGSLEWNAFSLTAKELKFFKESDKVMFDAG